MKKHLLKASIFTGLSIVVSGIFVGFAKFRKNHPMKLKDYTKYAMYMAVLDDEIVRLELGEGNNEEMGGEFIFPHRMETLKHRYNLFLELNKGRKEEDLIEEIHAMEEHLEEARKERKQKA